MAGIEQRNGCVWYYGNPAGYIDRDTAVVDTMLPCICPPSELECERSLGGILAVPHISDALIKNNCVTHKRMPYLTILGMKKGENEYTYPPYTEQQAIELLDGLRKLALYVVVDCGSYIANDILSAVALMEADSVLRLANCDLKSIGYFSSQLPLLKDTKWDADKQYKVASNVKPQQAAEHIGKVLGAVAFKLPYSQELEEQYLSGNLLADLTMAALVVLNVPLLKFINGDWYAALMHTVPGQIVLAVCAGAIFVSFAFVVKLTQPIENRR